MKTLVKIIVLSFIVLGLFFVSFGCNKKRSTSTPSNMSPLTNSNETLRIDLTKYYASDSVFIKIDNQEVFADSVSTSIEDGMFVARIVTLEYPIGKHSILVNVNGVEKMANFEHEKERIIFVAYDPNTSKISFTFGHGPLLYD